MWNPGASAVCSVAIHRKCALFMSAFEPEVEPKNAQREGACAWREGRRFHEQQILARLIHPVNCIL